MFCVILGYYSERQEKYFVTKKKRYLKMPPSLKGFFFLKKEISEDVQGIGRHFSVIFMIKDLVMSSMIVLLFQYSAEAQIFTPIAYNLFVVALVVKSWPLQEKKSNYLNLFAVVSETAVLAVFVGLYVFRNSSERFKYQVIGNLMVVVMGIIFVCYVGIGLFFTFQSLIGLFSKKGKGKEEAKGEKKISQVAPAKPIHQRPSQRRARKVSNLVILKIFV